MGVKLMNELLLWAEIDLEAIAHNFREAKRACRPGTRVMAVVKANAYGHGALEVARTVLENGADCLGVARAAEGLGLRRAGIEAPILVFGFTPLALAGKLLDHDLTQTIFSLEQALHLSAVARSRRRTLTAHLKIDTGMGRLGFLSGNPFPPEGENRQIEKSMEEIASVARLPFLTIDGIYTHFAAADCIDKRYAGKQLATFIDLLDQLKKLGLEFPLRHAANSAAIIDLPETHLDMVRAGIMLYGLYPSEGVQKERVELRPAMQLKSRVAHVREVPAGFQVSYGSTYETRCPTRLATVAVGYADGYDRRFSSGATMLIHGCRTPVVGRICMDQTIVDVGHIEGVNPGDEVVVFGHQGDECIAVEELADLSGTISYEVVSAITARVPLIYGRHTGR